MTRDDIIRMATEADREWDADYADKIMPEWLEEFAALVGQRAAAAEREACAKLCDKIEERAQAEYGGYPEKEAYLDGREFAARECADEIRARRVNP